MYFRKQAGLIPAYKVKKETILPYNTFKNTGVQNHVNQQ